MEDAVGEGAIVGSIVGWLKLVGGGVPGIVKVCKLLQSLSALAQSVIGVSP